jgi:hypothetical protein
VVAHVILGGCPLLSEVHKGKLGGAGDIVNWLPTRELGHTLWNHIRIKLLLLYLLYFIRDGITLLFLYHLEDSLIFNRFEVRLAVLRHLLLGGLRYNRNKLALELLVQLAVIAALLGCVEGIIHLFPYLID